jgi:exonuclease III
MTSANCTRVPAPAFPAPNSNPVSSETHDQTPPNSPERGTCDGKDAGATTTTKISPKFMKCKRLTIYSTLNCRTLAKTSRKQELLLCSKKNQIDILSIQEHRYYHPNTILNYTNLENYQFITASSTKNLQGSTVGGVGILLSPKAYENLLSVEKISDRIIIAEFNSNPRTTFIACYCPTNVSDEQLVDNFYSDLKGVTENVPIHNFLVIAGDFNSQIGPENALFTYNKATNRNGEKLIDFSEEFQLFITNTKFMKHPNRLWTFLNPSGYRSQIDYILVRNKWKNSVRDAQAYSSFSSVGSDHRVVSIKIVLSLRSSKRPSVSPIKQIDWAKVSSNEALKHAFAVDVKNRFEALSNPSDNIEVRYSNLILSSEEIALSTLPKKEKIAKTSFYEVECVRVAREKLKAAKQKYERRPTRNLQRETTQAQVNLDEAYSTANATYIQEEIDKISGLHTAKQHAAAWKTINNLSGRKEKPLIRLKGGTEELRKANWLDHFKKLLGEPPKTSNTPLPLHQISDTLDINTSPFTLSELKTTIRSFSNNKDLITYQHFCGRILPYMTSS